MSDLSIDDAIAAVIAAGRHAAARGWVPATAGNFSVRAGEHIAITRTGRDKGSLRPRDVAVVRLESPLDPELSAEAPLHFARYAADPEVGAVFHAHIEVAALLGRHFVAKRELLLDGWELQKAFAGCNSHIDTVRVPIVSNDQDTRALAAEAERELTRGSATATATAPGYLVAGHGVYAWGRTPADASRHLEAFAALLSLHLHWLELRE
jgi:methylthioribulose-1-phosphate dehydratase